MLGIRRSSISVMAAKLQVNGLIRYNRGTITIIDRTRLEATACECYGSAKHHLNATLPWLAPRALSP
jgi:Mn-dependent DtxR family transcriptional regulator